MKHVISVVIPIYKCGECLEELSLRLCHVLSQITSSFEVILVDDGCPNQGWAFIQKEVSRRSHFKGIKLSRNFGQHVAITAGLDFCNGEWVVVMDGDLQDNPADILKFYNKALEGYDIVVGIASRRNISQRKEIGSRLFYYLLDRITDLDYSSRIGNFGIYSSRSIQCVKLIREQHRSFGLFMSWVGFNKAEVEISRSPRLTGSSSYTLTASARYAISNLISSSNMLMNLMVRFGFTISASSLLAGVLIILRTILGSTATATGWSSVIVSLYFSTGLIVACLGVVGIYIGMIFDQVKDRPLYFIAEKTFDN